MWTGARGLIMRRAGGRLRADAGAGRGVNYCLREDFHLYIMYRWYNYGFASVYGR